MSKRKQSEEEPFPAPPTVLSIIDGALNDEHRTGRLLKVIFALAYCLVVVIAVVGAVITASGGSAVLSLGFSSLIFSWPAWKAAQKTVLALKRNLT